MAFNMELCESTVIFKQRLVNYFFFRRLDVDFNPLIIVLESETYPIWPISLQKSFEQNSIHRTRITYFTYVAVEDSYHNGLKFQQLIWILRLP